MIKVIIVFRVNINITEKTNGIKIRIMNDVCVCVSETDFLCVSCGTYLGISLGGGACTIQWWVPLIESVRGIRIQRARFPLLVSQAETNLIDGSIDPSNKPNRIKGEKSMSMKYFYSYIIWEKISYARDKVLHFYLLPQCLKIVVLLLVNKRQKN